MIYTVFWHCGPSPSPSPSRPWRTRSLAPRRWRWPPTRPERAFGTAHDSRRVRGTRGTRSGERGGLGMWWILWWMRAELNLWGVGNEGFRKVSRTGGMTLPSMGIAWIHAIYLYTLRVGHWQIGILVGVKEFGAAEWPFHAPNAMKTECSDCSDLWHVDCFAATPSQPSPWRRATVRLIGRATRTCSTERTTSG